MLVPVGASCHLRLECKRCPACRPCLVKEVSALGPKTAVQVPTVIGGNRCAAVLYVLDSQSRLAAVTLLKVSE